MSMNERKCADHWSSYENSNQNDAVSEEKVQTDGELEDEGGERTIRKQNSWGNILYNFKRIFGGLGERFLVY